MKLYEARQLFKEYATNKDRMFTSFAGKKSTSHTGKKADNIAAGKTRAYQDNTYLTKYEKQYPNLARLTQHLKIDQPDGSLQVQGPALTELQNLLKEFGTLKTDEDGNWILPVGDNIRLAQSGSEYFIRYNKKDNNDDKSMVSNPVQGS
jgi:hypothetical protein